MSLRKRRRAVAEINVVPYIDVMLVLLVIFIATAPVIMQGVKVDLPQAESKTLDQDLSDPAIIYVDREGRYSVQTGSNSTPAQTPLRLKVSRNLPILSEHSGPIMRIHRWW